MDSPGYPGPSKGPSKRYTPKSGNANANEDFSPYGWGRGNIEFHKEFKIKKKTTKKKKK